MPKYMKITPVPAEQFVVWSEKTTSSVTLHGVTYPVYKDGEGLHIIIPTLEGNHRCDHLDWVLMGIEGEFWPIKDRIFEKTYRKIK